jgi:uncharacterized protein
MCEGCFVLITQTWHCEENRMMALVKRIGLVVVMVSCVHGSVSLTHAADDMVALRKRAEAGDAAAQFDMGYQCLQMAAEYSSKAVLLRMPKERAEFSGLSEAWQVKCFEWWRMSAEQGHAEAQFHLGGCYEKGLGVEKNSGEAFTWYCKSAQEGYAAAQFQMGVCYEKGSGVEKNPSNAVKYYQMAADQNDAEGMFALGRLYGSGQGVPKNAERADRFFLGAAELGHAGAQYTIGDHYRYKANKAGYLAQEAQKDAEKVRKIAKTTRKGSTRYSLCARKYREYMLSAKKQKALRSSMEKDAVKFFRMAAEQGHTEAQYAMGGYLFGKRTIPGPGGVGSRWVTGGFHFGHARLVPLATTPAGTEAEALRWYRRAAAGGHAHAQFIMGYLLLYPKALYPKGLEIANARFDRDEGIKLLRLAAEQGHVHAMYRLGEEYMNGKHVLDMAQAAEWFARGAGLPERRGDVALELIMSYSLTKVVEIARLCIKAAEQGRDVQEPMGKIFPLMLTLAKQGQSEFQFNAAYQLEHGLGTKKNIHEAVIWYQKAAKQGNRGAKDALKRLGK